MKLNQQQKKAYDFFMKNNYLEVDAPRRSGKTTLCKFIVEQNPNKSFGVFTLCYSVFKVEYSQYKNAKYKDREADILIGDEVYLSNKNNTINVRTSRAFFWTIPETFKVNLVEMKKEMPDEHYETEFGKYL